MFNINTLNLSNVKKVEKNIVNDIEKKIRTYDRKWQVINNKILNKKSNIETCYLCVGGGSMWTVIF